MSTKVNKPTLFCPYFVLGFPGYPEGEGKNSWRDDRIFTGDDPCYPVELFIALIEGEASIFNHDQVWTQFLFFHLF